MKKFTKGTLVAYVDDDDHRIPEYGKNGWKEATIEQATVQTEQSEVDSRVKKAINDVKKHRGKKGKISPTDNEVNAAIKVGETAAAESEAVDDGLLKGGE